MHKATPRRKRVCLRASCACVWMTNGLYHACNNRADSAHQIKIGAFTMATTERIIPPPPFTKMAGLNINRCFLSRTTASASASNSEPGYSRDFCARRDGHEFDAKEADPGRGVRTHMGDERQFQVRWLAHR